MAVITKQTRAEILAAVKRHLNQESVTIHSTTQLNAWIQESALEHWKMQQDALEERDVTTATFTSTAGTKTYAIDTIASDNWDGRILFMHRTDGTNIEGYPMPIIEPEDEDMKTGWFLRGSNLHLSFSSGSVEAGQVYRVAYVKLPTDMDGDAIAHPLPIGHANVIIYDVVCMALSAIPTSAAAYERFLRRYTSGDPRRPGALERYLKHIEERTPYEVARINDVYKDNWQATERFS